MAKQVNLLSYWMPILRNLKEFKEIAKAEEPEVVAILAELDKVLNNMYIPIAEEYGISRYERILGIYPSENDDLETRRFRVLAKWNDRIPYTERELRSRLTALCGEDGYILNIDHDKYALTLKIALRNRELLPMVREMLDNMVPCNMTIHIEFLYTIHEWLQPYRHQDLKPYTHAKLIELIQNNGE